MTAVPSLWFPLFAARADRALPDVTPPPLSVSARRALGRSLARFQRGEAGEGRLAAEVRRLRLPPAHIDAVTLFIREEGRHARILERAVHALGEECLRHHWSDALFTTARRLRTPRADTVDPAGALAAFGHKMAVLTAVEVIGGAYYAALAARLPPSPLADALAQIAADEDDHFDFHRAHDATLAALPIRRAATFAALAAGLALVLIDHRAALAQLGARRAFIAGVASRVARLLPGDAGAQRRHRLLRGVDHLIAR